MSKTRTELRALLYRHMRDPQSDPASDPSFSTVTDINATLEDARCELVLELIPWLPERFSSVGAEFSYAADTEYMTLAAGYRRQNTSLVQCRDASSTTVGDNRPLRVVTYEELSAYATSGVPIVCAFRNNDLYLRPKAASAQTVTLVQAAKPTALANDAATCTELPDGLDQYYPYELACRYKGELGDPDSYISKKRDELHEKIEVWFALQVKDNRFRNLSDWLY